jgi:ubiquinone/menaquinone biosynthesis C-methylase UbiE
MEHLLDLTHQAETAHAWFRGFRRFVGPVLAGVADGRAGLRILDCGCGTGANLELARQASVGAWCGGFDVLPGGVSTARRRGLPVARGDISRIPFASAAFDVVTSFDVLQCLPDDRSAAREIARVTRRGGRVVVTLAALEFLGGDHGEVWGEVRRYTPASARSLMEGAGLEVERVAFLFASFFPILLAMRVAQRCTRPWREVSQQSDIRVPPAPVNAVLTALVVMESWLSRYVPMPFGSSMLVVARKP